MRQFAKDYKVLLFQKSEIFGEYETQVDFKVEFLKLLSEVLPYSEFDIIEEFLLESHGQLNIFNFLNLAELQKML